MSNTSLAPNDKAVCGLLLGLQQQVGQVPGNISCAGGVGCGSTACSKAMLSSETKQNKNILQDKLWLHVNHCASSQ